MSDSVRRSSRTLLRKDLSSYISDSQSREPLTCMGTDVSSHGMGIVSMQPMKEGHQLVFIVDGIETVLSVVWCKADSVRQKVYHIGLRTVTEANLVALCERIGILDKGEQANKEIAINIDIQEIKESLARCVVPDQKILRTMGYAKLADLYQAFPINQNGVSMLVLVANGMRPKDAAAMNDAELGQKLLVLQQERSNIYSKSRLKKVWPVAL